MEHNSTAMWFGPQVFRIPAHRKPARAFSIIESIASVVVIGALATVAVAAAGKVQRAGAQVKEINAAKHLVAAYHHAAQDHGSFLPGYDRTVGEVQWPNGQTAHGPAANRYPFRLGPYLDFNVEGNLLVNETLRQVNTNDAYSVSLSPSFGINYLFVGGDKAANDVITLPEEVATRPAHGANILVFASAARRYDTKVTHGFNLLTPPQIYGPMWSSEPWSPDSDPGLHGHIHPRYAKSAVCAFLDGSVRLLTVEELRDMRLWSLRAAEANNPNYRVAPAASATGRR
jgi:type II secretory pathway pseudopilin PulG